MYSLIAKPSSFVSQSSSSSSPPLLVLNRSQLYSSIRFPRKRKSRGRFALRAQSFESPPNNSSNANDSKPPNGSFVSICVFHFFFPDCLICLLGWNDGNGQFVCNVVKSYELCHFPSDAGAKVPWVFLYWRPWFENSLLAFFLNAQILYD